jgi:hypothetical protein
MLPGRENGHKEYVVSDLICISHLRWDTMQRQPQYLPSRLSRQRRILFIERPMCDVKAVEPRLEIEKVEISGLPVVTVVRLAVPEACFREIAHDDPQIQPVYAQMLAEYLETERYRDVILWLYDAAAAGYIPALPHKLLVYDAMEQLAEAAPRDEQANLLQKANIIIYRRSPAMAAAV